MSLLCSEQANQKRSDQKAEDEPTNPRAKKANNGVDLYFPNLLKREHQCRNRRVNDKQIEPRLERKVMVAAEDSEECQ